MFYSFIFLNVVENDNISAIFCRPLATNVHDAGEPIIFIEFLNCFVKDFFLTYNQFPLLELAIEKCNIWSSIVTEVAAPYDLLVRCQRLR